MAMDLTPQAISGILEPDKIRIALFINNQLVHAPIIDAVVIAADGAYLPLSGGTLTGALTGTAATFAGLLTTNGQVAFPATQNPSANVNTLDDYREGIWTPTILGRTTAGVGTYSTRAGQYTKIGNIVHLSGQTTLSAHTGTGGISVSGLPFSPAGFDVGSVYVSNMLFAADAHLQIKTNSASGNLDLDQQVGSTGAAAVTVAIDATSSLNFSITYRVV